MHFPPQKRSDLSQQTQNPIAPQSPTDRRRRIETKQIGYSEKRKDSASHQRIDSTKKRSQSSRKGG